MTVRTAIVIYILRLKFTIITLMHIISYIKIYNGIVNFYNSANTRKKAFLNRTEEASITSSFTSLNFLPFFFEVPTFFSPFFRLAFLTLLFLLSFNSPYHIPPSYLPSFSTPFFSNFCPTFAPNRSLTGLIVHQLSVRTATRVSVLIAANH